MDDSDPKRLNTMEGISLCLSNGDNIKRSMYRNYKREHKKTRAHKKAVNAQVVPGCIYF